MMPFLAKFSSEYLLWVSLLPEFKEFLDNALRHLVGAWAGQELQFGIPVGPSQLRIFSVLSIPVPPICFVHFLGRLRKSSSVKPGFPAALACGLGDILG